MTEDQVAGYYILAIACTYPRYICVERCRALFYESYTDPEKVHWMTQEVVDEMRQYKKNGMQQKKIAELFGISEYVVSRYMTGKRVAF